MKPRSPETRPSEGGFNLIEMVVAVTIMTILSLAAIPPLVRTLDRQARVAEQQSLQKLRSAAEQYIQRAFSIPVATNLFKSAATELGWNTPLVYTNARQNVRAFISDPTFRVGTTASSTIPFTQSSSGSLQPVNPRFLIISSLGPALPTNIVSGAVLTSTLFNELWNTFDSQKPASWTNWTGQPADLIIERLDLAPFFLELKLSCTDPASSILPYYRINGTDVTFASKSSTPTAWYIRGTELLLPEINGDWGAASREILRKSAAYTWDNSVWRAQGLPGVAVRALTPNDYSAVSAAFQGTANNPEASPNTSTTNPQAVATKIETYMNAYKTWANAGFPYSGSKYNALVSARSAMVSATANLTVSSAR